VASLWDILTYFSYISARNYLPSTILEDGYKVHSPRL